jgi:hypothetical protein
MVARIYLSISHYSHFGAPGLLKNGAWAGSSGPLARLILQSVACRQKGLIAFSVQSTKVESFYVSNRRKIAGSQKMLAKKRQAQVYVKMC